MIKSTAEISSITPDWEQKKKQYGYRVKRLAREAGVPWEIATLAGRIQSDILAISVLKNIKYSRHKATNPTLQKELEYGPMRKEAAIIKIIGEENYNLLYIPSSRGRNILAKYLLGIF